MGNRVRPAAVIFITVCVHPARLCIFQSINGVFTRSKNSNILAAPKAQSFSQCFVHVQQFWFASVLYWTLDEICAVSEVVVDVPAGHHSR